MDLVRSSKFSDSGYAYIDIRDPVPGRIVYDTGLWQIKNLLEGSDGIGSILAMDTISGDAGD